MSFEDRLRGSMRSAAGTASPTEDKWDEVLGSADRTRFRRRAQRVVVAGLSVAAIVAVAVGIMLRNDPTDQGLVTPPVKGSGPAYIVTAAEGRVVVRDSTSGEELRVLAEGQDADGVSSVAVSPDGASVYYARAKVAVCGAKPFEDDFRGEIVRLPITGGELEQIVRGASPLVSPDGSFLAYATDNDGDGCGSSVVLGVKNLRSGEVYSLPVVDAAQTLRPLSFSSDGSRLFVALSRGGEGEPELGVVTGIAGEMKVEVSPLLPGGLQAGPLDDGDRLAVPLPNADGTRVIPFDPGSGADDNELFSIANGHISSIEATREEALFVSDGKLMRWTRKDGVVTVPSESTVLDAAWASGPTKAPERFAAVARNGELQIRKTEDGSVEKVVGKGASLRFGPPRVAADGRYVYIDRTQLTECPRDPSRMSQQITRFDETGASEPIATGADPAITPDGSRLAYVTGSTCGHNDTLVVRDMNNGQEQRWTANTSNKEWEVSMPMWAPDGRMMTLTLIEGPAVTTRLLDTIEPVSDSLAEEHAIPVPDGAAARGHLTEDEILVTEAPQDATDLATIDPVSGKHVRALESIAGIHDVAATSISQGHVLIGLREAGARSEEAPVSLNRYGIGALDSVHVTDDVIAAAWIPEHPGSAGVEPQAGGRARPIVAASADGPIVEVSVETGEVVRTIADRNAQPGGRWESIALSADGETVYFERAVEDPDRGCEASAFETGEIVRVPRSGGTVEVVTSGRWPAISPDGSLLAYVNFPRCDQPGRLAVRELATNVVREWSIAEPTDGGPMPELVGQLSFDSDSRHMMIRVNREPGHHFWYVDTSSESETLEPISDFPSNEFGSPLMASFATQTNLLLAVVAGDSSEGEKRVVEIDPRGGTIKRDVLNLGVLGADRFVASFDSDGTDKALLFVVSFSQGPEELWFWLDGQGAEPTRLPGFFHAAVW